MNEHCSFGQNSGFIIWSFELGQNLGQVLDRIWAWFLHEKWSVLGQFSPPIGLIPIRVTQGQL